MNIYFNFYFIDHNLELWIIIGILGLFINIYFIYLLFL